MALFLARSSGDERAGGMVAVVWCRTVHSDGGEESRKGVSLCLCACVGSVERVMVTGMVSWYC